MKFYVTFRLGVDLDVFGMPLRTIAHNRYITLTARTINDARNEVIALRGGPHFASILPSNDKVDLCWAYMSHKTEEIKDHAIVDIGNDCWRIQDIESGGDLAVGYTPKHTQPNKERLALQKLVVDSFPQIKNKTQVKVLLDKINIGYILKVTIKGKSQYLYARKIERVTALVVNQKEK